MRWQRVPRSAEAGREESNLFSTLVTFISTTDRKRCWLGSEGLVSGTDQSMCVYGETGEALGALFRICKHSPL